MTDAVVIPDPHADQPSTTSDLRNAVERARVNGTAEPSGEPTEDDLARMAYGLYQQTKTISAIQREMGVRTLDRTRRLVDRGRELAAEEGRAEARAARLPGEEIAAMNTVAIALEPLNDAARQRVIQWALAWLADSNPAPQVTVAPPQLPWMPHPNTPGVCTPQIMHTTLAAELGERASWAGPGPSA